MRRVYTLAVAFLLCAASHANAMGLAAAAPAVGETFTNPVINRDAPDPSILLDKSGFFYLYATGGGVWRSRDMVSWTAFGNVFNGGKRPSWGTEGAGIWATDINYINGQYVLYYALSKWGDANPGIGVAVSSRPYTGFKAPDGTDGMLLRDNTMGVGNSIDPFYIEDNGHKYLFWGSFRGIAGIELSDDGLSIKAGAKPKYITQKHSGWTISGMEGTFIIKHGDYYYLIGSQGTCCEGAKSTYHLVMARSKDILGYYRDKEGGYALADKYSMLLQGGNGVIGPGHCSEWIEDDNGQWWIMYHGYDANDVDAGRKVYLDKVFWDADGWPYMQNAVPSKTLDKPVFTKTLGIEDPEEAGYNGQQNIQIPSMVADELPITLRNGASFGYQVVDLDGQTIAKGKATGEAHVDFYAVREGLYIVTVTTEAGKLSRKVVKTIAGN